MFSTQVYYFLVRLPVDDHVLKAFQSDSVSHREIFPLGQPFKSLYAIHALREYLSSRRRSTTPIQRQVDQDAIQIAIKEYSKALTRGMSLTIAAISDYEVIRRCASQELQIFLSTTLVESLVQTLKDPLLPLSDLASLDAILLERLLEILSMAQAAPTTDNSARLIHLAFQSILECCSASREFWLAFRQHEAVATLLGNLLLNDWRPTVRKISAKLIGEKIAYLQSASVVQAAEFREFLWPIVLSLIPAAMFEPAKCEDIFNLSFTLFKLLRDARSSAIDIPLLLTENSDQLLSYDTFEVRLP